MNTSIITYWDWLLAPFYILIIYIVASNIKNREIKKNPIYKYFLWGLFAKIFGAVCVCLIYVYYYKEGGDTLSYNSDSSAMVKLLFIAPKDFFTVWLSPLFKEIQSYFTNETGYLMYGRDSDAFMVVRLLIPLKLIGLNSYILTSILMAVVSYTGVWKLYTVFCDYFPQLYKQFALSVLFVPSVFFWGSGMLKDSWTIAAAGWYCYSFYRIFIKRESVIASSVTLAIAAMIMISIKPYIFVALLPGTLLWMIWNRLGRIKNQFLKFFIAPVIVTIGVGIGFFIWSLTSSNLGQYSTLDSMLQKAVDASEDLKQDYYGGNAFDLGKFDPTISGVLSKFPVATMTGLFRPFLWEAKNAVMLVSGLENSIILFFVLYILFRKPMVAITGIFSNPLVLFCLIFAIFFAFSVAISSSNFGSMVRLRIPQIPFFLSGLFIIYHYQKASITNNKLPSDILSTNPTNEFSRENY